MVHFEVTGRDGPSRQRFYGERFNWTIDANNPMGYGMVDTGSSPAGGIGGTDGTSGWATFHVEVGDPQATLERARRLGGKVRVPVTEVPGGPAMAQFTDPEGNVIGLIKAADG